MHFANAPMPKDDSLVKSPINSKPNKHQFGSIDHLVFGHPFAFDNNEVGTDLIEAENNFISTIFLVSITA